MKNIKNRENIPALYKSGLSCLEISKKVGLSRGAVHSVLKVRGVKFRTFNEAIRVKYPNGRVGADSSNWRGGRRKTKAGYIRIKVVSHPYADSQGCVMEHRLVMEREMGRYLNPDEIVHHKNGQKDDNRIENLELVADRGTHISEHFQRSFKVEQMEIELNRLRKLLDKNNISY